MKSCLIEANELNEISELSAQSKQLACCWKLAAVSQRGSSHELDGRPCQDAHSLAMVSREILVIAVADGAGSASFAEVGSDLAVRTSTAELCRQLALPDSNLEEASLKTLLIGTINSVRAALEAEAAERHVPTRELATTLLLVIATPDLVAAAQVGDGAVIVGDKDGEITGLTLPRLGEYINEVVFVISPNALQSAQVAIQHGKTPHIAVFSDGLQMLGLEMPNCTPYKGFFSPLFNFISEKEDELEAISEMSMFLSSQRVREKTDDDLTLVLATLQD